MATGRGQTLISIGYERRTSTELVQLVRGMHVVALVDVRLTPPSQEPGLSKRRLSPALEEVGIKYVHLAALGNPRANREPFRTGNVE